MEDLYLILFFGVACLENNISLSFKKTLFSSNSYFARPSYTASALDVW
jgi:hypothetical protein